MAAGKPMAASNQGVPRLTQWGSYQGRIEDDRLITGRGLYVADVPLEGMAYAVVVRAQMPSARVAAIDIDKAFSLTGVLAVETDTVSLHDALPTFPCRCSG